jgi:[CysO sulfur-carrier protein]-S-L-cysteine hydrolase
MAHDARSETLPEGTAPWGASEPWAGGHLRIARAVIDAVEADAVRAYALGEEACGYLRGPMGNAPLVDEHVAMVNVANKLHAVDPETYFRTARTYFAFNEKKFDDAFHASRAAGTPIKVLYHSHLDAGAYFSPTDKAVMSMGEPPAEEGGAIELGPGPNWPMAFLVTSVRKGAVDDQKLFVWDGSDFVESVFEIV